MGNHGWLRRYRGSRSHVNITFIMEEEHGHPNGGNLHHSISGDGSVDGRDTRSHMEVDQDTSRKSIPLSQRIITDCC